MKHDVEFICVVDSDRINPKTKTKSNLKNLKTINHFCKSNIAQNGISHCSTSFPPKVTTLPSLRRSTV